MPSQSHQAGERRFQRLVETLDHSVVWEFDDTAQQYTFVSQHSKLVLGYEAALRIGEAVNPSHYRYWHPTGTAATFGAAVAAASLLNLDAEKK